jgi:hypothetical protein
MKENTVGESEELRSEGAGGISVVVVDDDDVDDDGVSGCDWLRCDARGDAGFKLDAIVLVAVDAVVDEAVVVVAVADDDDNDDDDNDDDDEPNDCWC